MFVKITMVVAAGMMLVAGVWMRIDPAGFAEWAGFPNHTHFLHDAGVFQIGFGLMMVCALWWRDVIAVLLAGFVFANTFHAINHILDRPLGGSDSAWWQIGLFSLLAAAALTLRLRALHGRAGLRRARS